MVAWAAEYVKRGWHVLPVTATKKPLFEGGVHAATDDLRVIEAWWEGHPGAQMAVNCGASKLIVVDVDPRNGGTVEALGELPETLTVRTPGGGVHLYFSGNGLASCKPMAGIDVQAVGKYVLCPPSQGYEWAVRAGIVPLPDRLRELFGRSREVARLPAVGDGEMIPEGSRDDSLLRLGCQHMRRLVNARIPDAETTLLGWLHLTNVTRCVPPLDEEQVAKLWRQVLRYYTVVEEMPTWRPGAGEAVAVAAAVETATADEVCEFSDAGNAERFVRAFEPYVRFVPEWKWMVWDGRRWKFDVGDVDVRELAKRLPEMIRQEGVQHADGEEELTRYGSWALQSAMTARVDACLKMVMSDKRLRAGVDHWDSERLHLSVANGTVDLKTGRLWEHDASDATTFSTDVEYIEDARDLRWEQFLKGVTDGDEELEAFLQRCVGYSLTGVTDSESFFLIYGPMQTGKTTFIDAVQAMMGPYADTTDVGTFVHAGKAVRNTEYALAKMRGSRLIYVDELPENTRLDENLVKQITSGGQLQGRHIYGKPFTFTPKAKVWFATNHKPSMYDEAIWRRVVPVPFNNKIESVDPTIKEYFRTDARSAVLAWAVKGARDWIERGRQLDVPASVLAAIEVYRSDNDKFGQFIEECLEHGEDAWSTVSALYAEYSAWCAGAGEYRIGRNKFMEKFEGRVPVVRVTGRRKVDGRNVMVVHGVRPANGVPWIPHWT